jgi:hypothetical protein
MRHLYEEYTTPLPGCEGLKFTPSIALYVMLSANDSNEMRHFILACLARDGMLQENADSADSYADVLPQVPGLKDILEKI